MVYTNPNGHDWTKVYNWDGLGISFVAVGVIYSIVFYAMCGIVWYWRKNPVIKMRKPPLAITSLLVLHVYLLTIFLGYTLNGHISCDTEFWLMSFYLPLGIGLFQAQNQRLLLVSHVQKTLIKGDQIYITLGPRRGPRKWRYKLVQWWRQSIEEGSYEGYVAVGMIIQVLVSTIIFLISRKFTGLGIVAHHVSNGQCRRGWEWAPSIIWQFTWTWILGPVLIWKVRRIQDIYHWRLQTILCIIAGLPGSPLWLLSANLDSFAPVNKYWIPAAWLVPGLITMEMVTLGFAIWQLIRNRRQSRNVNRKLAGHEVAGKIGLPSTPVETLLSNQCERPPMQDLSNQCERPPMQDLSNQCERPPMQDLSNQCKRLPMQDLEKCISEKDNSFLVYLGDQTLGVENAFFLLKVQCFRRQWDSVFEQAGPEIGRARMALYRAAVNIFLCLVSLDTSVLAINISSADYNALEDLFGGAVDLVARDRPGRSKGAYSRICPWEEPATDNINDRHEPIEMAKLHRRRAFGEESPEFTINLDDQIAPEDVLIDFKIPEDFSKTCFDVAYRHIMQMVWTGPWQQYQNYIGGVKEVRGKSCDGICQLVSETCRRSQ